MSPSAIPSHLVSFLVARDTTHDQATDALEEWISHRRAKGDTLFEVSVGLAELEDKTPPHLSSAFDRSRYLTNVPPPSDLTPPMGPFPLARSASPETVLTHLLSRPPPAISHSREVILEYVLAREQKLREKKHGRGGKGTLGRDGFEEIARRLGEIEDGLRGGMSPTATANGPSGGAGEMLDEQRQVGMMLILSIRMSLSYFSLQELANQLLLLALPDAERTIVQHIRRRVAGEGRWGVGKELEYVEGLTVHRRPALRPAFRSAKARASLPPLSNYPITLPAPSKSAVIKLVTTFSRDLDLGGPSAIASYAHPHHHSTSNYNSPAQSGFSPGGEKSYFMSKSRAVGSPPGASTSAYPSSPQTPISSLPPVSPGILVRSSAGYSVSSDPNPLASYAFEVVAEYLTREKREHMLKSRYAKSGRDQLSKDLGEIEASLCLSGRSSASPNASALLPVFLLLRRTFALPKSPLPPGITDPYLDILPAPPDPDEVPFREPSVSSTTGRLYVNPRLGDEDAREVLEELVETEREGAEAEGGVGAEEIKRYLLGLVESVEKRFPDGSYANVFSLVKSHILLPPSANLQQSAPSTSGLQPALSPRPIPKKQASIHRRAVSHAVVPTASSSPSSSQPPSLSTSPRPEPASLVIPPQGFPARLQHTRSVSMPHRRSPGTFEDTDSEVSTSEESDDESAYDGDLSPGEIMQARTIDSQIPRGASPANSHRYRLSPNPMSHEGGSDSGGGGGGGGIGKVGSFKELPPLEMDSPLQLSNLGLSSASTTVASSSIEKQGQQQRQPSMERSASGGGGSGGWWDVVSAVEPTSHAPWHENPRSTTRKRTSSGAIFVGLPLPPGAEPAEVQDFTVPYEDLSRVSVGSGSSVDIHGPPTPPKPVYSPGGRQGSPLGVGRRQSGSPMGMGRQGGVGGQGSGANVGGGGRNGSPGQTATLNTPPQMTALSSPPQTMTLNSPPLHPVRSRTMPSPPVKLPSTPGGGGGGHQELAYGSSYASPPLPPPTPNGGQYFPHQQPYSQPRPSPQRPKAQVASSSSADRPPPPPPPPNFARPPHFASQSAGAGASVSPGTSPMGRGASWGGAATTVTPSPSSQPIPIPPLPTFLPREKEKEKEKDGKTSKLFGRSMTLASKTLKRDKENEKTLPQQPQQAGGSGWGKKEKEKDKDKARWDRGKVADIMGPSAAERRQQMGVSMGMGEGGRA